MEGICNARGGEGGTWEVKICLFFLLLLQQKTILNKKKWWKYIYRRGSLGWPLGSARTGPVDCWARLPCTLLASRQKVTLARSEAPGSTFSFKPILILPPSPPLHLFFLLFYFFLASPQLHSANITTTINDTNRYTLQVSPTFFFRLLYFGDDF